MVLPQTETIPISTMQSLKSYIILEMNENNLFLRNYGVFFLSEGVLFLFSN